MVVLGKVNFQAQERLEVRGLDFSRLMQHQAEALMSTAPELACGADLDRMGERLCNARREEWCVFASAPRMETDVEYRRRLLEHVRHGPSEADVKLRASEVASMHQEIYPAMGIPLEKLGLHGPDLVRGNRGQWYRRDPKTFEAKPFTPDCSTCGDSGEIDESLGASAGTGSCLGMQPCPDCCFAKCSETKTHDLTRSISQSDLDELAKGGIDFNAAGQSRAAFPDRPIVPKGILRVAPWRSDRLCECAKEKFNFISHERWCPTYVAERAVESYIASLPEPVAVEPDRRTTADLCGESARVAREG